MEPPLSDSHWLIKGKTFLVTGGTRGIGRGVVESLAEAGANVAFTWTSPSSQSVAAGLSEALKNFGVRTEAIRADVCDEKSVDACVDQVKKNFGMLDGLVNNAGVAQDGLLLRYKTEDWDRVVDTNLRGAFFFARAAARLLIKNPGSSIVNMSSVVGQSGNAGQAAYCASKAGLLGLTKSLALELAPRLVRVNAIAPGFIDTDMTQGLSAEQKQQILQRIPLNSLGNAKDIASSVLYLLSPHARYITGQILSVNGGMYM